MASTPRSHDTAPFSVPAPWFFAGAGFALALLLAHAWLYRFLCDDAFISFRYARNLSHGYGLVFNPGLEHVEGYTDFLWVVLLAGMDRLGIRPERAASLLSVAATIGLWAMVLWFAARRGGGGSGARSLSLLALVPCLLLAATRSVAVWSTSGLETRLYEVLLLGGLLRCAVEIEPRPDGERPRRALAGWLLGLAALTRPEGMLLGPAVILPAAAILRSQRRPASAWLAATLLPFAGLVGAHLAFRRLYYGDWLPNTYYAKFNGHVRASWGLRYLATFLIEYGVWLWPPLLFIGLRRMARRGRSHTAILFAAVAAPLLVYVATIGGDHFEYRPLDVLFPLAFLVLAEAFASLAVTPGGRIAGAVAAGVVLYALIDLPLRSHREFPDHYITGFPGSMFSADYQVAYLAPDRDPVLRLPGLRRLALQYQRWMRFVTSHFVGIRQEEHRYFLALAIAQGQRVRQAIDAGVLPPETRIAVDCVGAIPYYTDLPVLDRHGLTDAIVSRRPPTNPNAMAHEKSATLADGRRFGVDLWAWAPTDLVVRVTSPELLYAVMHPVRDSLPVVASLLAPDEVLLCTLPLGREREAARLPSLHLVSVADSAFQHAYVELAAPAFRALERRAPDDPLAMLGCAYVMLAQDHAEEALSLYGKVALRRPDDAAPWEQIAVCQQHLGRPAAEREALEHVVALSRGPGGGERTARATARLQALAGMR